MSKDVLMQALAIAAGTVAAALVLEWLRSRREAARLAAGRP